MRTMPRVLVIAVILAEAAATGCSSKGIDMPNAFCDVPLQSAALAPLLPTEGEVKTRKDVVPPNSYCDLSVVGKWNLNVRITDLDKKLPPEDWANALAKFSSSGRRDASFRGLSVIGGDGALVMADCVSPSPYVLFDVALAGKPVDKSAAGAKKLQDFLEDFVPAMTRKIGCTG
ncbi:hypothetical protein ACFYN0_27755 [Streptomyces sp. NPDC006704]|uniref:hypothetical protein n=1 Tax=Streptomyces sp. NPDC006704 TaxID=3364760 RepID=UPI00368E4C36